MAVDAFGHVSRGLDRDPLNVYTSLGDGSQQDQFRRVTAVISSKTLIPDERNHSTPATGLRSFSKSLRSKLRRKSNAHPSVSNDQRRFDQPIRAPTLAPEAPVKDDRFSKAAPEKPSLPPVKDFVTEPIKTIKLITQAQGGGGLAQNLAKNDTPHSADVQVIRAYEIYHDASAQGDKELAMHDLELLKKARQDSYVRWTLDRHVKSVGRIQAHQVLWKHRKEFLCLNDDGKQSMQWRKYGHHVCLPFRIHHYHPLNHLSTCTTSSSIPTDANGN